MDFCGLVKTSTLDYPGRIAAVLFSPGCNYDCFYCHNRELLQKGAALIDPGEVMDFLLKRQGLLDGVVLTGGEATLQKDIAAFAEKLKEMGYRVKLDTNGSRPEVVRGMLQANLLDYVALDYKVPWHRYEEICGPQAHPEDVKKTLAHLIKAGVDFELRTTVIPQLSGQDLLQMAKAIPRVPRFLLQEYREPLTFKPEDHFKVKKKPYGIYYMIEAAEKMLVYQPGAAVR